jgi:chorismate mutase
VLRKTKTDDNFLNIKLKEFRKNIDILDRKMVSVLSNRKEIVEQIAHFKQENKITIFQLERWFEILRFRKKDALDFGMDEKMIAEIFELIHKYSILAQTKIMRNANGEKLENKRNE